MFSVIGFDVFAVILAVDDAEIRFIAGAAVRHTGAVHTNLSSRTWCSRTAAACTAVIVIGFGIDAFDGVCCRSCTYIYITRTTGILACTSDTRAGCGIGNGMF